jgi:hypothetical protein
VSEFNRKDSSLNQSLIVEEYNQQKIEKEIKAKYLFMLQTVRSLYDKGLISDFSILKQSLESVFKKIVTDYSTMIEID